jgi:shikimate kinase
MARRAPLYAEIATLTVRTDGHRVREVVDQILRRLPSD